MIYSRNNQTAGGIFFRCFFPTLQESVTSEVFCPLFVPLRRFKSNFLLILPGKNDSNLHVVNLLQQLCLKPDEMRTKNILTAALIILSLASCRKKDKPVNPSPDPVIPTLPVTSGVSKKSRIDSISREIKKWELNNVAKDSVWQDSAGVSFFIRYTAGWYRYNANGVLPGKIINTVRFKTDSEVEFSAGPGSQLIKITTDNITATPYDTLVPASATGVDGAIHRWFGNRKNETVAGMGSGRGTSFNNYATIFTGFPGALTSRFYDPVPVNQLIPALKQSAIEKKTGCMVYSAGAYYRIYFDYDDAFTRYSNFYQRNITDKGFVSMITYGHEVYVFIESDAADDNVRAAVNRTLDGTETAEDISLLKQSTGRVYYRHIAADKVAKENINGYDRLKEYKAIMSAPFQYKGVPVYYGVDDMSLAPVTADRLLKVDFPLK